MFFEFGEVQKYANLVHLVKRFDTPARWRAGLRTRNVNLLLPKAPRSCKLRGVQTSPMSITAPKVLQRRHRGGVQEGLSFFLLQKASGGPRPVWTMYWERANMEKFARLSLAMS